MSTSNKEEVTSDTSTFVHHRLLENRAHHKSSEVTQGHMATSSSDTEHRRNWIPRRHNSVSGSSAKTTGMTRRCVCNLNQCASTNYMCKSETQILPDGTEVEAGCFVEAITATTNTVGGSSPTAASTQTTTRPGSARRGCIEMLSREKQGLCGTGEGPLKCCFDDDMCNYPKTFHSNSVHPTQGSTFTNSVSKIPFDPAGGRLGSMDHEVWLRAAVIAVPICGLIILILLIYIARKLLSSEDYKDTSYNYGRKVHHFHQKAGELLLPNAPHVLDLSMTSPPPPAGHCSNCWCSAPRSTAYLFPGSGRGEGTMDPAFCQGPLDKSLWNQLQEESTNQGGGEGCTNQKLLWQTRLNFLHSKMATEQNGGRDRLAENVDHV